MFSRVSDIAACRNRVRRLLVFCGCVASSLFALEASAQQSSRPPVVVNSWASLDPSDVFPSTDRNPHVAVTASGDLVAIWQSVVELDVSDGGESDVFLAQSSDAGRTWTAALGFNENWEADSGESSGTGGIAMDGAGNGVAVYSQGFRDVQARFTADEGGTWGSESTIMEQTEGSLLVTDVRLCGDGTWHVLVTTNSALGESLPGSGSRIAYIRSGDGQVWSEPEFLAPDVGTNTILERDAKLACDESGNLVATWERGQIVAARSSDSGLTWQGPVAVGGYGLSVDSSPDVSSLGAGEFVTVWGTHALPDGDSILEQDISFSRTTDGGATWTAPELLNEDMFGDKGADLTPFLLRTGDRNLLATWFRVDGSFGGTIGTDADILAATSIDGGVTWSPAFVVNTTASTDGEAFDQPWKPVMGPDGTVYFPFQSKNSLNGTIGEDFDIFIARSERHCPAVPAETCATPSRSASAKLLVKNRFGGSDKLLWKLRRGPSLLDIDLAGTDTDAVYALCIYRDEGSGPELLLEKNVPAAPDCSNANCWSEKPGRLKYSGAGGSLDGAVRRILLRSKGTDNSKALFRASGPMLGVPRLPLAEDTTLHVQLHNSSTGWCLESTHDDLRVNRSDALLAQ